MTERSPGDTSEDDPWDFGVSSEYPVLKVDFDRNSSATEAEFGDQPRRTALSISNTLPLRAKVGTRITYYRRRLLFYILRQYCHFSWS